MMWYLLHEDEEEEEEEEELTPVNEECRKLIKLYDSGVKFSLDPTRDVPDSFRKVEKSIVVTTTWFFDEWHGQPRSEFEWDIYNFQKQIYKEYDPIENEYWDFVKHELDYLKTCFEYYKM
jgi:hypothetical protein